MAREFAERLEECEIASPANAELHDHTVHVEDLAIHLVEHEHVGQVLTFDEDGQVGEQLGIRDGTVAKQLEEPLPKPLLCARSVTGRFNLRRNTVRSFWGA